MPYHTPLNTPFDSLEQVVEGHGVGGDPHFVIDNREDVPYDLKSMTHKCSHDYQVAVAGPAVKGCRHLTPVNRGTKCLHVYAHGKLEDDAGYDITYHIGGHLSQGARQDCRVFISRTQEWVDAVLLVKDDHLTGWSQALIYYTDDLPATK